MTKKENKIPNVISDNLRIFEALSYTNPAHTKKFGAKFGKTLTTVDAMHQIKNMTEHFGAVGKGWKYKAEYTYTDMLVFAEVTVSWRDKEEWYSYGAISSVCALYNKADKLDDEAPKKAMTDALTKAFSHLGLNADIFLGKFDNNKYVESMVKLHNKDNPNAEARLKELKDLAPRVE